MCATSVDCKTVITDVLMVKSGMYPHMISWDFGWFGISSVVSFPVGAGISWSNHPVGARDSVGSYPVEVGDSLSFYPVGARCLLSCCPVGAGCFFIVSSSWS
jgi:hypothetical protein